MKKFIAVLLILTVILAFAGCSSKEPAATEAPAAQAPVTEAPATEAPATEAPATEEVDESIFSYQEFLAAELDTEVVIESFVQAHQTWWANKCTVYCQDPEGAYYLYEMTVSQADVERMVPGTKIRIIGDKAETAGEVEIIFAICDIVEDGETYVAEPMDVTALLGTEELLQHQNKLAAFKGMTVEAIEYKDGEPGDDIYLTLGLNGQSYPFCVKVYLTDTKSDVYTTVGELEVGDVVDVEGFLHWNEELVPHVTAITAAE